MNDVESQTALRQSLKDAAKAGKVSVPDVLALSPKNDPFYVGSPEQIRLAEWFTRIWQPVAYRNMHLRELHYSFVGLVEDWDGNPYGNTDGVWNTLTEASKYARYLGFVPFDAIPDHKAKQPLIHSYYFDHEDPTPPIEEMREKILSETNFAPYNAHLLQPYHQEVWIEKSVVGGEFGNALDSLCGRYGANLIQGEGQFSITAVDRFMDRLQRSGKPGRIYYLCDWDPQGDSMPIAVARKAEYFNRVVRNNKLDCKLKWVALTLEQILHYGLPRTPIKERDLGKAKFEEKYGSGATEINSLTARHPGVLERMIEKDLNAHFDPKVWEVYDENERINSEFRKRMKKALDGLTWSHRSNLPKSPEGREPREEDDGGKDDWLYDSNRGYDDQLRAYKSKGVKY